MKLSNSSFALFCVLVSCYSCKFSDPVWRLSCLYFTIAEKSFLDLIIISLGCGSRWLISAKLVPKDTGDIKVSFCLWPMLLWVLLLRCFCFRSYTNLPMRASWNFSLVLTTVFRLADFLLLVSVYDLWLWSLFTLFELIYCWSMLASVFDFEWVMSSPLLLPSKSVGVTLVL